MTQVNTVDLSRRSPSYENRLSKYSHRGFEVYWPLLERSRVDPTIFERSFARTVGLFRLLVLEKLPKPNDCDEYLEQRRAERGRPPINIYHRIRYQLPGNVKDQQLNDVADWVEDEKVSNYHTFQVPYGPKYHAKKVSRHRWCFQSYIFASSSSLSKERHPLPLIDNHGHVFIVSRRSLG